MRHQRSIRISSANVLLLLILAGCGSGSSGFDSFDPKIIQSKLSAVVPNCNLEKVTLSKEGEVKGLVVEKEVVDTLINHLTDMNGVLDNPQNLLATYKNVGWINSPDENVFSWNLNKVKEIFICNTNGVPLSGLSDWYKNIIEQENALETLSCDRFYKPYSASDAKRAKKCLEKSDSIDRNGEWIVLTTTEGITPKSLVSTFMAEHNKTWPATKKTFSSTGRSPIAFTDNFTLNIADAGYLISEKQNSKRNELWISIVKSLSATTWNELDTEGSGYPGDYSASWFRPSGDSSSYWLPSADLKKVINREIEVIECNEILKINVNSASQSDCGKLKVEIFQSDLNTGGCTFLAQWNDDSGSSRIGIFRYCDAFASGSFEEDSYYTIRVRVDGPESYTTTSGVQSRVLGFTVLGN